MRHEEECIAPGCPNQARAQGYCPKHYQQIRRHGRLSPEREYMHRGGECFVPNCNTPPIAKGVCFRHYQQIRRHGRLTPERERIYERTGCMVLGCQEKHSSRGYCKRHYMSEFYLPNRDSEKHLGKSKLKAAAVQTDGWVCDRETDVAILVAINQLTKQLGRTPTSYEVMWELHGQIPEEEIEKVALAADVRERTAT